MTNLFQNFYSNWSEGDICFFLIISVITIFFFLPIAFEKKILCYTIIILENNYCVTYF